MAENKVNESQVPADVQETELDEVAGGGQASLGNKVQGLHIPRTV